MKAAPLDLVCFHWGSLPLAVPATRVTALARDPSARRAGVAPTAAEADPGGDAAARPIIDLGGLLGLPPAAAERPCRLLGLRTRAGERWLVRVQEPVYRVPCPADALRPLPPLLATCLRLHQVRAFARLPAAVAGMVLVPVLVLERMPA